MVFRVAVASGCVILLYCNNLEYYPKKFFFDKIKIRITYNENRGAQ